MKNMNKILNLFDEEFVLKLFRQEVLPHYPEFIGIKRVKINPYKNMVWRTTYHVVIGFETHFLTDEGDEREVLIVCSAHSNEPRRNVYSVLKYLWKVGLPTKFIDLPDPIFYSQEFNGTFYAGLKGDNLLYYIKSHDFPVVNEIVAEAARLFTRLHSLPIAGAANFNTENSRIATVIPGKAKVLEGVGKRYDNKYNSDLEKIYDYLIAQEEKYFASGATLTVIHGDAHPENIIRTAPGRLGLIDFTDLCLGDRARDLGTFVQQLEYRLRVEDAVWSQQVRDLFLNTYWKESGLKFDDNLKARFRVYYNWTALRTVIYWFLRFGHNEAKALSLLEEIKADLKI